MEVPTTGMDDPALGPPDKMDQRSDELTPMLSQYYELATEYDDHLLLFQVGDFYEAFCEAAETLSRLLEITLTQREDSTGTYAMAGIPIDNAESYLDTLLDAGYRIAIADQVQDPDAVSGVVERAVTRIITPGMVTESELLADETHRFVASLTRVDDTYGLAFLDVSTGEFIATSSDHRQTIADELDRFDPVEMISDLDDSPLFTDRERSQYDHAAFSPEQSRGRVEAYFGSSERLAATSAEIQASGALLSYAEYTRGGRPAAAGTVAEAVSAPVPNADAPPRLSYITQLRRYDPREYMLLDSVALQSLELFDRRDVRGADDATLFAVIDETVTALGRRRLTEWLRRPLLDRSRIEERHDAVEALVTGVQPRETVREELEAVYDIQRLVARISRGRADARDLRSLVTTLAVIPQLRQAISDIDALASLRSELDPRTDLRTLIDDAIREDPPTELTEGGLIKDGYDAELDRLRQIKRDGKAWIDSLEATERDRTGIDSLKVGHNEVHGYYIEVTDPNLDAVPDTYQRRQTLKNAERFVTPELKERETELMQAATRADELEYDLFREVRAEIATATEQLQSVADALAKLDALAGLATLAATRNYTRPELLPSTAEPTIEIEDGRHPIVESRQESFVPNDTHLDRSRQFAVITGPNMSGKSTYMRQVAVLVVLAQAGSFVPATAARITPIQRIFTRVGANDDIAGGRSTFMIEMLELSAILRHADDRSLVLLDEVGRGTSTTDGLAIARAITEYIHDQLKAPTLFATHHHELTDTAAALDRAFNLHFEAEETDDSVTFSHELQRGAGTASYGIEVAKEAGVPPTVVERARSLLTESHSQPPTPPSDQQAVLDQLRAADVAHMTPVEALNELAALQTQLEDP